MVALHKNTNAPLILIVRDVIFWFAKHIIAALCCSQDNLGVKKGFAPSKNPSK
jgi:hypothetical protein